MNMNKYILLIFSLQVIFCHRTFGQTNSWVKTNSPEVNIFALTVNSDGLVFAGSNDTFFSDSGVKEVYRSSDLGETWQEITNELNGGVEALSLDGSGNLWAGVINGSGIFKSGNNGDTWTLQLSEGVAWDFEFNDQGHVFAGVHGLVSLGFGGGIQRSLNNGQTWQRLVNGLLPNTLDILTLAISEDDVLYAGGRFGLYRSVDNGDNWQFQGLDSLTVTAMVIDADNELFVSTRSDGLFRSTDGGTTLESGNNGLSNLDLRALSLNSNGDLFAGSFGSGVFLLPKGSSSWNEFSLGLSDSTIFTLAISSTDILYAGTLSGVFKNELFVTSVGDAAGALPTEFALSQNYPNPFNPTTSIRYELQANSRVLLSVYNIVGERVRVLVDEPQTVGAKTVVWDGRDDAGNILSSGLYVYEIQSDGLRDSKKMLLLK